MNSKQQGYVPGSGYKAGYDDRIAGRARAGGGIPGPGNSPYWDEYRAGYNDADNRIIEDARAKYGTNQFLSE